MAKNAKKQARTNFRDCLSIHLKLGNKKAVNQEQRSSFKQVAVARTGTV